MKKSKKYSNQKLFKKWLFVGWGEERATDSASDALPRERGKDKDVV